MKFWRIPVIGGVLVCFCLSPVCATNHGHITPPLPETIEISLWAREEVNRAMELGIGPKPNGYPYYSSVPDNLASPISRGDFCTYVAYLIAVQQGCDEPSLTSAVCYYMGEIDPAGHPVSAFSDTVGLDTISALSYLGVIQGRGEGVFDPAAKITRQEAAVFLARAYQSYGGVLPVLSSSESIRFMDDADIAAWAKDDVTAMAAMGIMIGDENGLFSPHGLYSTEQCLVTLTRLFENAPVSRKNENVRSLFSYEEYIAMLEEKHRLAEENNGGTYIRQQVEGSIATFVETETGGSMNSATFPKFIYRFGAMKAIDDLGVCDTGRGYLSTRTAIEDPYFSADGTTFFCTITLSSDVPDHSRTYPNSIWHGHAAGTYQVSIDVETCKVQTTRQ